MSAQRLSARPLYEQMYCARGDVEIRIKEQQLAPFADRTRAQTLRTNQLRLYFAVFADRLRDMACLFDRVDLLGYLATDPRVHDAPGTLSVPLAGAAAYYPRETVSGGCGEPAAAADSRNGGRDRLPERGPLQG